MKKNWPLSRDSRELIFSEKLLNIRYECAMPKCTNMETSTGWLCVDLDSKSGKFRFFLGFECPADGLGGRWKPELQPLIDEVIQDALAEGFDLKEEIRIKREEHQRKAAKYKSKFVK